jgi:hypothetical protein
MTHWKEIFRQKLAAGGRRLFSAPFLSAGLIWTALIVAMTDLCVILLAQPAGYWITSSRAESDLAFLDKILASGLGWYIFVAVLYLGLLGLCLTLLTRSVSLVIWLAFGFLHLNHSLNWLSNKLLVDNPFVYSLNTMVINLLTGLILGIVLVILLLHPKSKSEPKRLVKYFQKGLPATWVIFLIGMIIFRAVLPKSGWQQIKPEHSPGVLSSSAYAYDPVHQRAVMFGGVGEWIGTDFKVMGDTWEWDGTDWQEKKPEQSPSARSLASMAYDKTHGVMVLFGGRHVSGDYMLNDTWIWDGNNWKEVFPEDMPWPREGAQMFFDDERGQIIIAGGYRWLDSEEKNMFSYVDTWAWDGTDWHILPVEEQEFSATTSSIVYDPNLKQSIVFDFDSILTWKEDKWQRVNTSNTPPFRYGPGLAIDPISGKTLLFGGISDEDVLSDTWFLEGNTWQELSPDLTPSPRLAHAMFYDPVRKSFVLYGGQDPNSLGDMWEFVVP